MRVHYREAGGVACRDVAAHLAVVGVHVVDGKSHIAEMVAAENVAATGDREYPVAAKRYVVVFDSRPGRIPDRYAVTRLVDATLPQAHDPVAARHGVLGAMQIDAV